MNTKNFKIDNLQYCNWSKEIFKINSEAKLDAIHVTIAYHEDLGRSSRAGLAVALEIAKRVSEKDLLIIGYDKIDRYDS